MGFFIYENWQARPHKAVIHRGSCGFCKEGNGAKGGTNPKHGRWHGPFESLEEARQYARRLPKVEVFKEDRCI